MTPSMSMRLVAGVMILHMVAFADNADNADDADDAVDTIAAAAYYQKDANMEKLVQAETVKARKLVGSTAATCRYQGVDESVV